MAHGLSLSAAMLPDKPPLWVCDTLGTRVTDEEAEGSVRVEVDGPDDREGTSGPRPAKVPSRCISLVTSLASYVRAEEGLVELGAKLCELKTYFGRGCGSNGSHTAIQCIFGWHGSFRSRVGMPGVLVVIRRGVWFEQRRARGVSE